MGICLLINVNYGSWIEFVGVIISILSLCFDKKKNIICIYLFMKVLGVLIVWV